MKFKQTTSLLAIAALLGAAGVAAAETQSSSYSASVSVLTPDQTGFIIGGQVAVNGIGSGALTLSRSVADMSLTGSAYAGPDTTTWGTGETAYTSLNGVDANSNVQSSLGFDRSVYTSGSLVGTGNVVSRGEAIASMGSAGAASAGSELGGVDGAGIVGSASADSTSQGSLNGSLSTSNSLQILGTSSLFAGSNEMAVGESNRALAYGSSDIVADGVQGIDLTDAAATGGARYVEITQTVEGVTSGTGEYYRVPGAGLLTGSGNGALFAMTSSLGGVDSVDGGFNTDDQIAMSVSNAGNGTISVTTSTGGFFTGGGAAGGASTFSDIGSFFSPRYY